MFGVELSNFMPESNEGLFVKLTCIAFLVLFWRTLYRRFRFDLHQIPQPGLLGLLRHNIEIAQMKDLSLVLRSVNDSLGFPKMFKVTCRVRQPIRNVAVLVVRIGRVVCVRYGVHQKLGHEQSPPISDRSIKTGADEKGAEPAKCSRSDLSCSF